jgi:hypothetical protein
MTDRTASPGAGRTVLIVVAWLWVLIPFLYGVYSLLLKIGALF